MDLEKIRQLVRAGQYEFSIHAQQERLEDDLDVADIEAAILAGEIIEEYPKDPRGPSCLILGYTSMRPVHIVVGWAGKEAENEYIPRVITVYIPQPPKWRDPRTRGEQP